MYASRNSSSSSSAEWKRRGPHRVHKGSMPQTIHKSTPRKGYREIQALSYSRPGRFAELLRLEAHTGRTIINGRRLQANMSFDAFESMTPEEESEVMCNEIGCMT